MNIIDLEIDFPDRLDIWCYELWAPVLIERASWTDDPDLCDLSLTSNVYQIYCVSLLQVIRLLWARGKIPLFSIPKVRSVPKYEEISNIFRVTIEIKVVHFFPQAAYEIPVRHALTLCGYMAKNPPNPQNRSVVFKEIENHVTKLLRRLVPSGSSTFPLLQAADRLGIPFFHIGHGIYQIGWGSKARRLDRSSCELDSAMGAKLAQNKVATTNILRIAGLPTPPQKVVMNEEQARLAAVALGYPVVVKPADRDRGEGVSVGVCSEADLKSAFARAYNLSNAGQVIVERQVSGVCHRVFIANGAMLYAVKRLPMSVRGDGFRTIRELVAETLDADENKPPWRRSGMQPIDVITCNLLDQFGLSLDSIPAHHVMVPLRPIESTEHGGVDEDVTHAIHPDNIEIALQASRLVGLSVAGVDIISRNIAEPWFTNGAVINEINYSPLLGGAEISKSYLPAFFDEFLSGNGTIPIVAFKTEVEALAYQRQQIGEGRRCFLTSADQTIDSQGRVLVMSLTGVKQRVKALIMRLDVDAISVVTANT
jgi:D-alanine-D-alanine ligase-like ATP-grasp enzyme